MSFVDFNKQCSDDCKKCEVCKVVGLEGEKNYQNCNQECSNCMRCKPVFQTPSLSYSIPIPEDYLTLTHQPEFHPYYPMKLRKKHCEKCDNFYLEDHLKHNCFNMMKNKTNNVNIPNPYNDSKQQYFFYKFIGEY